MKPGQTSPQLIRASNGSDDPSEQTYLPNKIRLVQLKRRGAAPLGFSIRGGREHGTGVFVSQVSGGSEAHHRGLRVGDQIIRINGYPIDHFIHEEVLALLKARPTILLKVKSVGMIPIKDNKRDPITWKMVEPDPCSSGSDGTHSVSSGSSLDEPIETKVFISGIGGSSLGCSVVKGPPELPGIFVQTVKLHGLAEIAGLEIGDQITEVNGQGFLNVEFSEAIAMLKSCKEMALTVRKGAGLELFPEERLRRRNVRLCNGHAKGRNGNGHLLNGNHTMHNRTLYTNGNNGKASPESFHSLHDTITNGSLSEMSDRSTSLSSSQSTSPVTNGYTTHPNGNGCQKHRSTENGGSHYGSSNSHVLLHPKLSLAGSEERQRLEEEKRRLYEKEQLLKMEAEKLAEERRKLEVQKSLQEHHQQIPCLPIVAPPCNIPAPPQMHVFAELHSVAQQRRMSREKGLQNGTEGSRKAARTGLRPDAKPSPDVLIKQKQHVDRIASAGPAGWNDSADSADSDSIQQEERRQVPGPQQPCLTKKTWIAETSRRRGFGSTADPEPCEASTQLGHRYRAGMLRSKDCVCLP
ncbi:putative pdzk7 [Ixodes scapularis]